MDQIPAKIRRPAASDEFAGGLVDAEWHTDGVEIGIEFDRDGAPLFPMGEVIEVAIVVGSGTMVGHGRVRGRHDTQSSVAYRVHLDREGTLQLGTILNRREAIRVRPGEDEHAFLRFDWPDGHRDLIPVHDVSGTGLSVLVDDPLEQRLLGVFALGFYLLLTDVEPLAIEGRIRNRAIEGSQVMLGLEFDAARTPEFGFVQEQVYRWVSRRYQQLILAPPRSNKAAS